MPVIEGELSTRCVGCGKDIAYYLKWCNDKCKEVFKNRIRKETKNG